MTRPNIVLICADDIGFNEIGITQGQSYPDRDVFAGARVHTPHIDAIGRDGAVLTRHYTPSAICTPARFSLLTGRFASRAANILKQFPPPGPATITWNTDIRRGDGTLGTVLQNLGYRTGYIGKWHNGQPKVDLSALDGIDDPYDPIHRAISKAAYESQLNYLRDGFGFDFVDRVGFGNREGFPPGLQVHNLEWFCEGAEQFIDENQRQPFFLYLAFNAPHGDYFSDPMGADPRLTPGGPLPEPPICGMPPRAEMLARLKAAGVDPKTAMATWQDDCVGAVVAQLKKLGLYEKTVVIFTGDHLGRGKNMCYEGCRIPFFIRWPGHIPANTTVNQITSHIDLAATLAGLAGGALPNDYSSDGLNFAPLVTAPRAHTSWREQLLLECSNIRGVVTDRYKYIACRAAPAVLAALEQDRVEAETTGRLRWVGWEGKKNPHAQFATEGVRYFDCGRFENYFAADQLYDLSSDVFETKNLASDATHAATLSDMQHRLAAELAKLPHAFGEFSSGSAS